MVEDVPQFAARYLLVERLSKDAAGAVWRAYDDIAGRQVVLRLHPTDDPAERARFAARASALATVSHPGVPRVLDHGETDDECYLAATFVTGTPIFEAPAPLDPATVLDAVGQAALALQAVHEAGVAHGPFDDDDLLVAADGGVSVVGFAPLAATDPPADLASLGALARRHLGDDAPESVRAFLDTMADPAGPARTAREVGREALALAAAQAPAAPTAPEAPPTPAPPRGGGSPTLPQYDDAARRRVRNRLLLIGLVVVVGGLLLLMLVGGSGGKVNVPDVRGLSYHDAVTTLAQKGLRATEQFSGAPQPANAFDPDAVVLRQSPKAGVQVKAGTQLVLTVSAGTSNG
ncbi:MAG TPA: PASTA domain-containing protein [Mycobacteriales bacterium]|nr:PASTA domain-containing protein [Mycobacteriales bacterium]